MSKPKGLLIAEKPSLMTTIKEVYGSCYSELPYSLDFVAQHGHLVRQITPDSYGNECFSCGDSPPRQPYGI